MYKVWLSLLSCLTTALALGPAPNQIKNIVTFGDSYSDIVLAGDGGTAWPLYVADYANLTLFPFARAGATCSNNLTEKPFPSVFESQLPTFFEEVQNGTIKVNFEETMFTLWIGTNDVGVGALLTGDQKPNVTLVDTVSCAVNWVKALYEKGARNFIFQNMNPLQDVILYSANSYPNHYWLFQRNTTEWSIFMTELTTTGNALSKLMLQNLAPTLKGAHLGLFDSHSLFTDMFNNPAKFLNGTAPLNVTGAVASCVYPLNANASAIPACTIATGTDRDSFLWFDELHPSEQADRNLARQLANAIQRKPTDFITWFS